MLQRQSNLLPPSLDRPDETDGVHGVQPEVGAEGVPDQPLITMCLHRPHVPGDEDLSVPTDEAILPNSMLVHSDILEIVMNIRNESLRKLILSKENIDYTVAVRILINEANLNETVKTGDNVTLKLDMAAQLPKRVYKVEQVSIWFVL